MYISHSQQARAHTHTRALTHAGRDRGGNLLFPALNLCGASLTGGWSGARARVSALRGVGGMEGSEGLDEDGWEGLQVMHTRGGLFPLSDSDKRCA